MATLKLDEIGRMIALAERLASEGQMNLNKILEAIAYAQMRRASWNYRPEITTQTIQSELAQCLEDVKQAKISPQLITVLEIGLRALAEERDADLLIQEAPDAFVCRACGYTTLESASARCPECNAWAGNFRKFVAFFNKDNAEPDNPIYLLRLLQKNASDLIKLVSGFSEDQLAQKPNPNNWSIRDHIAHIYDTQVMLDTRVKLMLENENPELTALAVYNFATDEGRHPETAHEIQAAFISKRSKCIELLQSLPLKDLWRPGMHPEFGQMTILRQAAYLAYHEVSHLSEIDALCVLMN
ncbi:MAG TPA: DinB family protein [Anaerolineales bacterium]|nr:DinB family protein [Anaerolineales bacterium]